MGCLVTGSLGHHTPEHIFKLGDRLICNLFFGCRDMSGDELVPSEWLRIILCSPRRPVPMPAVRSVGFTTVVILAIHSTRTFSYFCRIKSHSSRKTTGRSLFFSTLHVPTNTVILIAVRIKISVENRHSIRHFFSYNGHSSVLSCRVSDSSFPRTPSPSSSRRYLITNSAQRLAKTHVFHT